MKTLKMITALGILTTMSVQAKVVCVASCVKIDLGREVVISTESLIKSSVDKKQAEAALNLLCPNTLWGSVSEGGTNQHLGEVSCTTI